MTRAEKEKFTENILPSQIEMDGQPLVFVQYSLGRAYMMWLPMANQNPINQVK
jgi:hypothetical protein